MSEVKPDNEFIVTEGWLHDIKAALSDSSKESLRQECIEYVDAKLKGESGGSG